MRLAKERHQVVLAHGVEVNVAHQHHFVAVLIERFFKVNGGVFGQAGEYLFVHTGNARRRFLEAFAVGVFAHALQNHADASFNLCSIHRIAFFLAMLHAGSAAHQGASRQRS